MSFSIVVDHDPVALREPQRLGDHPHLLVANRRNLCQTGEFQLQPNRLAIALRSPNLIIHHNV
jgi:hypothetical protein